ncbi:MAG: hypothetical protein M3R11_02250, partial [Acidobacteriota bacterium]|nr:hypothetical protein [Acidobacteriota bacterium]
SAESPIISYEAVDVGLIEPRKRDYTSGKAKSAVAQQAEKSGLPLKDGAPQVPEPYTAQKPENTDRQNTVRERDAQIKDGESFKEIHEDGEEA